MYPVYTQCIVFLLLTSAIFTLKVKQLALKRWYN